MIINVKVFPGSKKELLKEEFGLIKIYLNAPPIEGRANKALVAFLADHFKVKKGEIEIIKGLKSKMKTINIKGL